LGLLLSEYSAVKTSSNVEKIVSIASIELIAAAVTEQGVITGHAEHSVIPGKSVNQIIPSASEDVISSVGRLIGPAEHFINIPNGPVRELNLFHLLKARAPGVEP